MNVSLYQAAAAMNASAQWQEVIASNLAATSVPGFRKDVVSFSAIEAGMMPAEGPSGREQFQMPTASTAINFSPGEYRQTGRNTDVAIEGQGFFEVELPDGRLGYTRDGEFGLNSSGKLVTKDGYLVMGDGGPFQVDLSNSKPLAVSASGEVSQGADVKGRFKVVNFNHPQLLQRAGGYFFADSPDIQLEPVDKVRLKPGALEGANTSPMSEMNSLLTAMRMFETNSRLLQMQDQHLERVTRELTPTG